MPAPQVLPYVYASDYVDFRVVMADTVPRDRNLWTRWLDEQSRQASARGLGVRYVRIDLAALKDYLDRAGNRPGLPDLLRFAQDQARLNGSR